jgi:hypothetical protein
VSTYTIIAGQLVRVDDGPAKPGELRRKATPEPEGVEMRVSASDAGQLPVQRHRGPRVGLRSITPRSQLPRRVQASDASSSWPAIVSAGQAAELIGCGVPDVRIALEAIGAGLIAGYALADVERVVSQLDNLVARGVLARADPEASS